VSEIEKLKALLSGQIDDMCAQFNQTSFYEAVAKCHRTLDKIRDLEAELVSPADGRVE